MKREEEDGDCLGPEWRTAATSAYVEDQRGEKRKDFKHSLVPESSLGRSVTGQVFVDGKTLYNCLHVSKTAVLHYD